MITYIIRQNDLQCRMINWFLYAGNIDLKWSIFTLTQFTQPTITCSKLTIETLEQDAKHV